MFNEISIKNWKILEIFLPLDSGKELQASLQHAAGAPSEPLPPDPPLRRTEILEPPMRKYRNSAFVLGSEAKLPEAIEFVKLYSKTQWKPPIFGN